MTPHPAANDNDLGFSTLGAIQRTIIEDNIEKLVDTSPVDVPPRPRILIVKMWAIGDILMATPLLRALHRQYPGCSVTWFADKRYAAIIDGNPMIDEVIAFDSPLWRRYFRYGQVIPYLRMSLAMRRDLIQRNFDVVINLTAEKWWVVWFQVAPIRIGLFPRKEPGLMGRLYTKAIPRAPDPWLHNSEHYLLPAPALGIPGPFDRRMSIPLREEDADRMRRFLAAQPSYQPGRPLVVLHPGTSQDSKCWPPQYFAGLIDEIGDRYNVAITGSPDELGLIDGILARLEPATPRPIVAAGALTDLRETVALVKQAAVVVTGDTSVLHIASAVETPLIGVYGSTRPGDNGPFFGEQTMIYNEYVRCSPCGHANCPLKGPDHMKCMHNIPLSRVFAQVVKYVEQAGR